MEKLIEKTAQSNCVSWENRIFFLGSLRNFLEFEYENLGYDIRGLVDLYSDWDE